VIDFALDIRANSPTFGQWKSVLLTGDNKTQFFIPRGFAHGFLALEDNTIFSYKVDNFYNKESERGVLYSDPEIGIQHKLKLQLPDIELLLSEKDLKHPLLKNIEPYKGGN
jgi:dTDP-4-dehydrorhamnose 3,5-epimerase